MVALGFALRGYIDFKTLSKYAILVGCFDKVLK